MLKCANGQSVKLVKFYCSGLWPNFSILKTLPTELPDTRDCLHQRLSITNRTLESITS